MENKELFAPILQEDEEIIKVIKPNKTRYVHLGGLAYTLLALIPILAMAVPLGMAIESFAEYGTSTPLIIELTVFGGLILLGIITTWVGLNMSYKKTFYAYTNKRILIRRGFIGVDYATLDFEMIGGLMVNVNFLDRLMKGSDNPGTITFGSSASPVIYTRNGRTAAYAFRNIDHPYEVYRDLKHMVDEFKAAKAKQD
ncbi:MAG: PH domain-containing protein [Bacilli bacterium]|nr:PH domain-containing protein [Bacilli bacterium]